MLVFREARAGELGRINGIYAEVHFVPSELPRDRTFYGCEGPASPDAAIVCLGRINQYPDALEVGGFWVRSDRRGRGHARRIVAHVLEQLSPADEVYCIPFAPLVPFYASFGFELVSPAALPASVRAKWGFCSAEAEAGRHKDAALAMRIRR